MFTHYYNTYVKTTDSSSTTTDNDVDFNSFLKHLCAFLPKTINQNANNNASKDETLIWKPISLKIDLNDMKSCLAKGYPFVFGAHLFKSFFTTKNGYVSMPQEEELSAPAQTQ